MMANINISGYEVLIDDEDIYKVNLYKWWINKREYNTSKLCYFVSNTYTDGKRHIISLHRYIMNCKLHDKVTVDHINGNTLDCRKSNLRICTHAQNCRNRKISKNNSSGYRGVFWNKRDNLWCSQIVFDKHRYNLGRYSDNISAAKIFDIASIYFYKEYAKTNFPVEDYLGLDYKSIVEKAIPHKTSIYRGVHWDSHRKHWLVTVLCNNHHYYAGQYTVEIDAAKAYDKKAYELLGNKAKLNFPLDSISKS